LERESPLEPIARRNQTMDWKEGEIDEVAVRAVNVYSDDRGWLAEIFRADETPAEFMPAMSYISVTKPGVARGPHAHIDQADMFAFMGPGDFELKLWDNREDSPTFGNVQTISCGTTNPLVVIVPAGVVHGYKNISEIDAWVVNCPNRLFAGEKRAEPIDEVRYEELHDSPFVM